jgi:hypothetical protein
VLGGLCRSPTRSPSSSPSLAPLSVRILSKATRSQQRVSLPPSCLSLPLRSQGGSLLDTKSSRGSSSGSSRRLARSTTVGRYVRHHLALM